MIGTIAVSELGGPIQPSPSGPSQPSAPTIHPSEKTRPVIVNNRSEKARRKSTISAAISSRANPTSGAIPVSMASEYSSSITTGDRLLTRRGPAESAGSSSIRRSTSWTLVSPVSCRRILAMVNRRAVCVAPAHRGKRPSDLGDAEHGVDLGLSGGRGVDSPRGLDQQGGRDDRISRCQEFRHARAGEDVVEEGVHLGEPARSECFAAEHQRHHAHVSGLPEELVQILHCGGDGAPRGKERHRGPLDRRQAFGRPGGQHDGDQQENEDRDVRPDRDQPAEPVEQPAHVSSLYLPGRDGL